MHYSTRSAWMYTILLGCSTKVVVHVNHSTLVILFSCSAEAKSLSVSSNALPVKDGAPRRSLNLEDYKKRRGLIWCGRSIIQKPYCMCNWLCEREYVCVAERESVCVCACVCVCVNDSQRTCDWMLIQQTVYPNTRGNTDWAKTTFFSKDLSQKKFVQIFVVLLFLHNHTQTRILSCVFFMYLTSFPPLLDLLESTPFFCFCFFWKDTALVDYYLEQGHYLRRLRLLRHFEITGLDILTGLTSSSSPTMNCCKSFPPLNVWSSALAVHPEF